MKQSSESRVCVLCFTRDCVMLFNPQEYKVFETERNTVWKWFKRVGGVGLGALEREGWGFAFCNSPGRVKPSEINRCGDLVMQ